MEENLMRKNMWNGAGAAGLALAGASTVYMFAAQLLGKLEMSSNLSLTLAVILWACKFGGCIWLMRYFMKKFVAENPEADNKASRRFGVISALLSATLFAAASFANVAYISPDVYTEQMNALFQQMAPLLDSNTMAQVNDTMENLPRMTFFSNLFYCFIYGALLSAILSIKIPDNDPFSDYEPEEE